MKNNSPILSKCNEIMPLELWEYHYVYFETINHFKSCCNFKNDEFNIYICQSINCHTSYDKENDYIIFDKQLARLFLRCNALWLDEHLQKNEFFLHLCFLIILHETVSEELVFFIEAAFDLFSENVPPLTNENFWKGFDFDSTFETTHIQNQIALGHEIYHRYLVLNPPKKNINFNKNDSHSNFFYNSDFVNNDSQFLEECICDWFSVKTLLDKADNEREKKNLIKAYMYSLLNLSLLSLVKSLASIPEDSENRNNKVDTSLQKLKERILYFTEHIAHYAKTVNEDSLFYFSVDIASSCLNNLSSIIKERLGEVLEKFSQKIIEKSGDDFVKYYPKIGHRNNFKGAISQIVHDTQNFLFGEIDIFDCCIFSDSNGNQVN